MRPTMRRGRAFLLLAAGSLALAAVREARAAGLTIEAPPACVDPTTLAQEVGDLLGRPLGEVADVDFRVRIVETSPQKWRLHLEMIDKLAAGAPVVRGSRDIEGASCGELAEAASVAISVSVRSMEAAASAPPAPAPVPPPSKTSSDTPAVPTAVIGAKVPPPPAWRPSLAFGLTTDTGALPSTSPGLELEGDLQRGGLRLVLLATWFSSEDAVSAGASGTFQLALGGGLACYAPRWGRWTALACGGGELGRLAGTGLEVARPETGSLFWRAVRADAGATAALGANTAILLRAGVVRPLARPDFVLDESQLVYRPSAVSVRVTAGFELGF
jgi:hypothetical protein